MRKFSGEHESWKEKSPLELVHYEIYGAKEEESMVKNIYFLTFIYDFSHHTLVYFIKIFFKGVGCYKNFKAMAKKQVGIQLNYS